jgi:hypothetical protein
MQEETATLQASLVAMVAVAVMTNSVTMALSELKSLVLSELTMPSIAATAAAEAATLWVRMRAKVTTRREEKAVVCCGF